MSIEGRGNTEGEGGIVATWLPLLARASAGLVLAVEVTTFHLDSSDSA